MHPKIVRLDIEHEIDGFERTTLTRLLNSFESIELEAIERRRIFLKEKAKSFDPDIDDQGLIEENAYFKEVNHILIEKELKQEFLNSTAVWLFHMFERQKIRVFGSANTNILKPMLTQNNYNLNSCFDWEVLNKELRNAANVIKHGFDGNSGDSLRLYFPNLIVDESIVLSKTDIQRYIKALRNFWVKALKNIVAT